MMGKTMLGVRRQKRMRKIMRTLCAEPVVTTMRVMNSGFAVTLARSGSMASVSKSPLHELSTSSSTSALAAATSVPGPDGLIIK